MFTPKSSKSFRSAESQRGLNCLLPSQIMMCSTNILMTHNPPLVMSQCCCEMIWDRMLDDRIIGAWTFAEFPSKFVFSYF
jgi:hypothetical protein